MDWKKKTDRCVWHLVQMNHMSLTAPFNLSKFEKLLSYEFYTDKNCINLSDVISYCD